ncbi:1,2-dihydroxy-3-keto-5-methylthiopentene dioxygenase [Coccidioides immitis H538.4]|uniref:acireductone dioxygenase (Fe(2+)-requiring) n=1 Tax=Coccidioides immitis H538.4 TaxID=396776 RepID=A0A0J8RWZ7_COCIT|nr:1,2-dihydroxy-3-keto-5-methylthiopentene dioxygenase [Coccidioides immitis H538.4]
MKAYWYDNKEGDQRARHDSGRAVEESYLSSLGVLYRRCPNISDVDSLASDRGYKNRDEITISPEKMGDVYEEKVKMFFHEHLHEDEEIRYILDGEGYFDVRSEGDEWYIKAMRLFQDEPKWTPLNRSPELTQTSIAKRICNLGLWLLLR